MKLNHILDWMAVVAITGSVTFSSCKKDNSAGQPSDTPEVAATIDATQSDALAEEQFDDVFNITMGVQASDAGEEIGIETGSGVIYRIANPEIPATADSSARCFKVKVVPRLPHIFPKTVTIDFGTGCTGKDGKLRKGKIVTVYTGPMFISGSKTSTTFVDYSVDSFKIQGTHTVENTSSSNRRGWTVKVIDGKITNTNTSNWKKWSSEKSHTQVEGNGTPFHFLDDVFQITGNASGSNSNNNSWTALITTPLIKKAGCRWIVKGTLRITRNTNMGELDYGNGGCDNRAIITINGISHDITLH